jgi:hypothetical protein
LRKVVDHPFFKPVEVVTPFKETEVFIVMNYKTKTILWSEKKYKEADAIAKAMAQTLNVNVALIPITVNH